MNVLEMKLFPLPPPHPIHASPVKTHAVTERERLTYLPLDISCHRLLLEAQYKLKIVNNGSK